MSVQYIVQASSFQLRGIHNKESTLYFCEHVYIMNFLCSSLIFGQSTALQTLKNLTHDKMHNLLKSCTCTCHITVLLQPPLPHNNQSPSLPYSLTHIHNTTLVHMKAVHYSNFQQVRWHDICLKREMNGACGAGDGRSTDVNWTASKPNHARPEPRSWKSNPTIGRVLNLKDRPVRDLICYKKKNMADTNSFTWLFKLQFQGCESSFICTCTCM